MREIPNDLMTEMEHGAREGVKALRAFLTYQGNNTAYEKRAKAGGVLVTGYTRLFASETNRAAVELAALKMNARTKMPELRHIGEVPATDSRQDGTR